MTIETKYSPRDHVWTIHTDYNKYIPTGVKCSFCNGTGYAGDTRCFAKDGYKSKCRNGIIFKMVKTYFYGKNIVEVVEMSVDQWGIDISYKCDDNKHYDESELYATKEEAQAECDRRNAECNSPQQ